MADQRSIPPYESNLPDLDAVDWYASGDLYTYDLLGLVHNGAGNALRGIFPDPENYTGFHLNPYNLLDFDQSNFDVQEILANNVQPLIYCGIAAFFAVCLIIIGIVWCIGRLCCTCSWLMRKTTKTVQPPPEFVPNRFGGPNHGQYQQQQYGYPMVVVEPKPQRSVLSIVLAVFLILFLGFYLTCLVGLSISNSQLNKSIQDLSQELDSYLGDAEKFIGVTKEQIDAVLIKSYNDLSVEVRIIGGCPPLYHGSKDVREIGESRDSVASELESGVLDIMFRFDNKTNIPALSSLILKKDSLMKSLRTSEKRQRLIAGTLCEDLEDVGTQLASIANEMNSALEAIPIEQIRNELASIETQVKNTGSAIFYTVTVFDVFMLIIFIGILLGTILLLAFPKKKWGSFALNFGLFAIFILGWLFWSVAILVFLLSGILVVVVPGTFQNVASNGTLVNGAPAPPPTTSSYVVPSVPYILKACEKGEAAYTVFKLDQVFDIQELDELLEILLPASSLTHPSIPEGQDNIRNGTDVRKLVLELQKINSEITNELADKMESLFTEMESKISLLDTRTDELTEQVSAYVEFAQETIETDVGVCTPLYNVLTSAVHTFSYKMGSPIGAYWLSLNVLLLTLFPVLLASAIFLRQ